MLAIITLLSLAASVVADVTFTLTAQGSNINSKVGLNGTNLGLTDNAATFVLQTPSGYLTANGQDVILTPQGIQISSSDHSKDFGVEDGKLRSGASSDKFDFYSCPDGTLANFQCSGGVAISLLTGDVSDSGSSTLSSSTEISTTADTTSSTHESTQSTIEQTSSSEAPLTSSSESLSSASVTRPPVSESSTETDFHSTLVTVTSCENNACHSKNATSASASTYDGAAAQAKFAAGAIALAGALLL